MRCDLHLHTTFSPWRSLRALGAADCTLEPIQAFELARARGMDLVAFTDHDTIDGALEFLARRPAEQARVIVGEEVEARFHDGPGWVHLNVWGVTEDLHADIVRLRADAVALARELSRRRVPFALNHPFQSFPTVAAARRRLAALLPFVPAVEVVNATSPRGHAAILERWLAGRSVARVGGSDAHTPSRVACVWTEAAGHDTESYLASVMRGACAIGGHVPGAWTLVRDVYRVVGTHYAGLLRPRARAAGRARTLALSVALAPFACVLPALAVPALHARQSAVGRGFDRGLARARTADWRPAPAERG